MTIKEAIEIIECAPQWDRESKDAIRMAIEALKTQESIEPLTDDEQRIFLAAISREEKACKKVDDEWKGVLDDDTYNLVSVCQSIERKVKKALWS